LSLVSAVIAAAAAAAAAAVCCRVCWVMSTLLCAATSCR
jgi:hypothetical protein